MRQTAFPTCLSKILMLDPVMKNDEKTYSRGIGWMWPVAILLLLATGVIVTCWFLHDRQITQCQHCVSNLCLLDGAKENWAVTNGKTNGDEVIIDKVMKFAKVGHWDDLKCPTVGSNTYTLGRIGEKPRCCIHGAVGDSHLPNGKKPY